MRTKSCGKEDRLEHRDERVCVLLPHVSYEGPNSMVSSMAVETGNRADYRRAPIAFWPNERTLVEARSITCDVAEIETKSYRSVSVAATVQSLIDTGPFSSNSESWG